MNLSKSRYCKGIQCPKILWMDANMPEEAADLDNEAIYAVGNEVGDLARHYFGDYSQVEYGNNKHQMVEKTLDLIKSGVKTIAEASFLYKGLFCSVDILRRNGKGWDIIEVKSSTHVTDIYVEDMAFQCYVLLHSGIKVKNVINMHLNNEYIRFGDLDLCGLFTLEDYTDEVFDIQDSVKDNISYIDRYMQSAGINEPVMDIGPFCDAPYVCAYKGYCGRHLPKPSVFNIIRLTSAKKYEYYQNGIVSYADVIESSLQLNANQLRQVETAYYHSPDTVDIQGIMSCIKGFTYPLYFLDFETYQQAIPQYDGIKPYMQVPFQYSLHTQKRKKAPLEHYEFLGKEGTDPRRALAERLCGDIPKNVCTLAYNMSFEKGVIKNLAAIYPDLVEHLMNIHDNIKDLMTPFQKQYYYSERLEGSYSIKYVLPAMCPGDPELDYHSLDGIHNGSEAMNAFATLANHTPQEIAVIRRNLLSYCRLDTLAMVKILEKLKGLCGKV